MADTARKRKIRAAGALLLAALCAVTSVAPAPAAVQSTGNPLSNVKVIDNPSGGHVYLGIMQGQPTTAEAMGRVLQRVAALCGDRPQLGRLVKNKTGQILAGFFSVTATNLDGKPMEGLAIVYAPNTGTAGGAVLLDDAARFPTTVNPMFALLKQQLEAAPSSGSAAKVASSDATADAAARASAGSTKASAGSTKASAGNTKASAGGTKASAADAKAAALQTYPFPDGSGEIGLPAGWHVASAQKGDAFASGPLGEVLRFGWVISAINSNGAARGTFVAIPYATDPENAFKAALTQWLEKARRPAPTIDVSKVEPGPSGGNRVLLDGDIDFNAGKGNQHFHVLMIRTPPQRMNLWTIQLFMVYGPAEAMAQETDTISAIYSHYSRNVQQIVRLESAQAQQDAAVTRQFVQSGEERMDSTERMTAGMSNLLRDQTVVVDTETGGHATTSNGLASALIDSNPNLFQSVSPSGYISGVDY